MLALAKAAQILQSKLEEFGLPNCVIGGLALQAWGELRFTRDIDLSVLTGFGTEEQKIRQILTLIRGRQSNVEEFAILNRVILGFTGDDIAVDIGLAAFPYEEQLIARAIDFKFSDDIQLRICTAEDLIVMKTFAGRGQDWVDIQGVIQRQSSLNWPQIEEDLTPLLELVEEPERLDRLTKLRQ